MNLLKITDLKDGKIQVSWQHKSTARDCPHPLPFADPLTIEDRKELRWYLEEYLQFPYGAEEYKAQKVEEKMKVWGESLFTQVFAKCDFDPDPRTLYHEAVRQGLNDCEICIASEDTDFLNIPWELLRDPTPGRGYLAPLLGGLYRQRTGHKIEVLPESSEPFRILLVICRPFGEKDVPLGTVARPMLEALRPLRPQIHLEVLRPPTFDALVKKLNTQRGYYHLVHFDGHGVFARDSGSSLQFGSGEGMGYLVFEKEDGTEDIISSEDLGQALATSKVPLFVLNACQSAEEGKEDPYSSVASQLIAVGAKGVVAMSYSVYAVAASKFMQRFYERLVDNTSLSEAVAAGRQKLFTDAERESVVGKMKLKDWMVPTLYQQEYQYVPIPKGGIPESAEEYSEAAHQKAEKVCPEGRFGFIGRDYDMLRIERALYGDDTPWVLLTGVGGTGKTALAYGFARWYAETGGCPRGVFVASFKEKADFGQVIGSIVGFGTDFSMLSEEKQWQYLVGYLCENPCLLIWDNFEPVAGYPQGAVPLATDEEQKKLSQFLKALKGGESRVIITTRKPDEDWLGISYELVPVTGLTKRDAGELAKSILKTVGRRPEEFRNDPEYARLLNLFKGHPRSMEIVLPHLRNRSPAEIIEALQHRIDSLGDVLDASLAYVVTQLSERTQKHLPFIGLFTSYVSKNIVGLVSGYEDSYQKVMGESLDAAGWKAVLQEAASVGLIRQVQDELYEIHPTLPSFLQQQLVSMVDENGLKRLDSEFMKFYGGLAGYLDEHVTKGDQNAVMAVIIEEANFLRALRLAEMNEQWGIIQAIVQTLYEFYEICGRTDEWNALRRRLLSSVGEEMSADADRERASVWMYLLGEEANRALQRNELAEAEAAYQRILRYLGSLNNKNVEPKIAVVYHQLGRIAEERQQFDEAETWYRKALEIYERLGLERYAASDYHQLGIIAQERQQFDEAETWYRKALEIYERLGLERYAASDYHQLGMIAEERQQFDEAETWYRKALEIKERLGHPPLLVNTLAQFGVLRRKQNRLHESVAWFGKALTIAAEYKMRVTTLILRYLALSMKSMGEKEFTATWQQTLEQEPPLEVLRQIIEELEKGST